MAHQFLFYANPEAIGENRIRFNQRESHHISDVLRCGIGERIEATDGQGRIYKVKLTQADKGCWTGKILEKHSAEIAVPLPISLALPCVKGDRWETALESACEMGVQAIWLVDFAQATSKWSKARWERAERKAIEALKQSSGSWLTLIQGPCGLEEALSQPKLRQVWTADRSADPLPGLNEPVLLVVGPESGLAEAEIDILKKRRSNFFGLGARRLRSEMAAVAAIAQAALQLKKTDQ